MLFLFLQCPFLCSHSGIGGLRKNRNKKAETIRIFQESIHLCPLRRFIWPNTKVQALWIIYTLMRLCFCGRTRTLPTLVSIIQRFRGFRKTKYKRIRPEKVEGFPDRIRLAKSMLMRVFLHISDSMVNPVLLDYQNPSSTFAENPQCTEYGTKSKKWERLRKKYNQKPNLSHLRKKVLFRTNSIIDGIPYGIKS